MNENKEFKESKFINYFKFRGLTSFPFVEQTFDAVNTYQLLSKIVEYLNQVINQQNILIENMNELIKLYNELKEYVDTYFDNLDIQNEIDNKLEEMAESGQLTEIVTAYLQIAGILAFNTVNDMIISPNLIDGSFAKTYGYNNFNDKGGANYKIREVKNTDIIDGYYLIALQNPDLVAELEITDISINVRSVEDMKELDNLNIGNVVQTVSFYLSNSGGGARYLIRELDDTVELDEMTKLSLSRDDIYAELIFDKINVKEFGARGDGLTDDTIILKKILEYVKNNYVDKELYNEIYFPKGTYLITDTLSIKWFKNITISGVKSMIKMNQAKPILYLNRCTNLLFKNLMLFQENFEQNSSCIKIEQSFVATYENLDIDGGDHAIDFINGNNHIFSNCWIHRGTYNFYTDSRGDNTNNTFINCDSSDPKYCCFYFGGSSPYYGQFNIENCYIESPIGDIIIVDNGMRVNIKNSFINHIGEGVLIKTTGITNSMNLYLDSNQLSSTSKQAYLFKNENANAEYTVTMNNNGIGGVDSGLGYGKIYNFSDTISPKIRYSNSESLDIPNYSNLKTTDDVLDYWITYSNDIEFLDSSSPVSLNDVKINNGAIAYRIYLEKNVLYNFSCLAKINGVGIAKCEIYDDNESYKYVSRETANQNFEEINLWFSPPASGYYKLYYQHNNVVPATYTGFKSRQFKEYINTLMQ